MKGIDIEELKTYSKKTNIIMGIVGTIFILTTTSVMVFLDYHVYINPQGKWWQMGILHLIIYSFTLYKWRFMYKYWNIMRKLYSTKS